MSNFLLLTKKLLISRFDCNFLHPHFYPMNVIPCKSDSVYNLRRNNGNVTSITSIDLIKFQSQGATLQIWFIIRTIESAFFMLFSFLRSICHSLRCIVRIASNLGENEINARPFLSLLSHLFWKKKKIKRKQRRERASKQIQFHFERQREKISLYFTL